MSRISLHNITFYYNRKYITIHENFIYIAGLGKANLIWLTPEAQIFIKNTPEYKKLVISRLLKEKINENS